MARIIITITITITITRKSLSLLGETHRAARRMQSFMKSPSLKYFVFLTRSRATMKLALTQTSFPSSLVIAVVVDAPTLSIV